MLFRSSKQLFIISACLGFFFCAFPQSNKNIVGVWKGTSICQVKNSPCRDENVVYHILAGKAPDSFYIQASKVVNGVEDDMGTLAGTYDAASHLLTLHFGKNDTWQFKLSGKQMDGTLINNKVLYRIIELKKEE